MFSTRSIEYSLVRACFRQCFLGRSGLILVLRAVGNRCKMTFLRAAPMMVCAVPSVWKKCQNRNLCLLFAKFDPHWSQIDPLWSQINPLWSQSQPELSRLQDQNTKMSSPFKRFTTMPFTRYMYTFPELGLHCAFSSLSRTLKLGLLSNLSWLSKRLYNLFFSKNLIQSLGSWAKNVVVVRSVQVKSCSVMEMQLTVCFVCFRPACFRTIYF